MPDTNAVNGRVGPAAVVAEGGVHHQGTRHITIGGSGGEWRGQGACNRFQGNNAVVFTFLVCGFFRPTCVVIAL